MKKYILHPAQFKLDGGAMFGIIPKPLWSKNIIADELNRIPMSLRVVYLETAKRKILIDTGIGDYHGDKFNTQFAIEGSSSPLESILQNDLNINADEITDIIITHLHFDHVGGLGTGADGTTPIFKNATIHLHQQHWEYSKKATVRDKGSFHSHTFEPLLAYYQSHNQLHLLTEEGGIGVILEDNDEKIEYKVSFGHTPYMVHPIFDGFIYMADLVPMQHHIRIPWVMGYDIEPGITTEYKQKFYQYIIDNKLKMIFEHDQDVWGGPLGLNEKNQFILTEKMRSNKTTFQELDNS